jgi:alginate O-acetyltransferase complex protein AlgI
VVFNSPEFAVFFAAVLAAYWAVGHRWQNRLLLLAGYVFYGWWNVRFLYLIALSTVMDFSVGAMIGPGRLRPAERAKASAFLLLAAAVFVVPNWSAVRLAWHPVARWGDVARVDWIGWAVLGGTVGVVALANGLYPWMTSWPDAVRRRRFLVLTVVANLCFLGFFKYCNFFVGTVSAGLAALHLGHQPSVLRVLLPIGISFYTFQSLSYTIDVYRGRMTATPRLFDFALFVAFFPPMVAGPIERARALMPQLQQPRSLRYEQATTGLYLILLGLVKKVAIADGIAGSVAAVYDGSAPVGFTDAWAATFLFAAQIYCDFSGYSDIAIGVAKLLGIDLMTNFNLPYVSRNPGEFWRRWHISLSTWLRDYLYIPLGGNRQGQAKTYRNLMLTMLLGGLWHGAAWNFVLWGGYQGALQVGHGLLTGGNRTAKGKRKDEPAAGISSDTGRPVAAPATHDSPSIHLDYAGRSSVAPVAARSSATDRPRTPRPRDAAPSAGGWGGVLTHIGSVLLFLVFCCYGWMLFRANGTSAQSSLHQIGTFTKTFLGLGPRHAASILPKPTPAALAGLPVLVLLQAAEYWTNDAAFHRRLPAVAKGAVVAALLVVLDLGLSNAPAQFIYFQF